MNAAQVARWLRYVEHRPGWTFTVTEHPFEGVMVRVEVDTVNTYRPPDPITLGIDSFVPPCRTAAQFYDWLLWRLHRIESHECREWFRVNGTAWRDPHKEDA